jgi:hypothetical protein
LLTSSSADLDPSNREFSNKNGLIFHFTIQEEFRMKAFMESRNGFNFQGFSSKFGQEGNLDIVSFPRQNFICKISLPVVHVDDSLR